MCNYKNVRLKKNFFQQLSEKKLVRKKTISWQGSWLGLKFSRGYITRVLCIVHLKKTSRKKILFVQNYCSVLLDRNVFPVSDEGLLTCFVQMFSWSTSSVV